MVDALVRRAGQERAVAGGELDRVEPPEAVQPALGRFAGAAERGYEDDRPTDLVWTASAGAAVHGQCVREPRIAADRHCVAVPARPQPGRGGDGGGLTVAARPSCSVPTCTPLITVPKSVNAVASSTATRTICPASRSFPSKTTM